MSFFLVFFSRWGKAYFLFTNPFIIKKRKKSGRAPSLSSGKKKRKEERKKKREREDFGEIIRPTAYDNSNFFQFEIILSGYLKP